MDKEIFDKILESETVKLARSGNYKFHFIHEGFRCSTFCENWPHDWLCKTRLAQAGFFYTGLIDAVMCYFCEIILFKWEFGDQPILEHYKYSPKCLFLFDPERCSNEASIYGSDELNVLLRSLPTGDQGYDEVDG